MTTLLSSTPVQAWSPFRPEKDDWTIPHVAHLYRRFGFGANWQTLRKGLRETPEQLADTLLNQPESSEVEQISEAMARSLLATGNVNNLPAWWLHRMLQTETPLREKMTLFWHGHFATGADKVDNIRLIYRQNQTLRDHALGDFRQLVHAISRDPAMLLYLDSASNRKTHPNENFAREIMELFVLGEGNYTEQDIRELARCFTGWELRRDEFYFNRYQHDFGEKTIFGKTGEFSGEEGVDLVLNHPAGPTFIAEKLLRFFVTDEDALPPELVEPLASRFAETNGDLKATLHYLMTSNLFYSPLSLRRKIRSPIDFVVGFLRSLDASTNLVALDRGMTDLGQRLFFPPNVKGWEGGRNWINSSTLLARTNLMQALIRNSDTRFGGESFADYCAAHGKQSPGEVISWLAQLLLAKRLTNDQRRKLTRLAEETKGGRDRQLLRCLELVVSLPEYHLA